MIFSSRPPPSIFVIHGDGTGDAYVRYLTAAGFRVGSAPCIPGAEIVDRTLATMPDLIMLDCDCVDAVERLKADPRTAAIPVIVVAELLWLADPDAASVSVPRQVSHGPALPASGLTP